MPYQRASRARRCRIYQIGHLVQGGERKLVIGHAARSYVALHHFIEALDTVFELAVRSPLEAGVKRSVVSQIGRQRLLSKRQQLSKRE